MIDKSCYDAQTEWATHLDSKSWMCVIVPKSVSSEPITVRYSNNCPKYIVDSVFIWVNSDYMYNINLCEFLQDLHGKG